MAPPNNAAAIRGVEIRRTTVNQPPGPQEPIPPPVEPVAPAVQPDPAVQPAPAVPPAPAVQSAPAVQPAPADQPAPDAIPDNPSQAVLNFVSQLVTLDPISAQRIQNLSEQFERSVRMHAGPAGRRFRVLINPSAPPSSSSGSSNERRKPAFLSLEHATDLPIVQDAMGAIRRTYNMIKGSNCLIRLQLDMAESIVGIIERISRPLRQTMGFFLSYPIKFADNVMLIILLIVEEMVPVITLPSDQLLENAKQFIRNSPMKYCIHCIQVLARLLPSRRSLMNEDAQEFHYQNENNEQEGINPQVLQDLLDAVEEQQQNVTLNISVTTQNANGSAA